MTARRWRPGTGWPSRAFADAAVALVGRRPTRRRRYRAAATRAAETIVDGLLGAGRRARPLVEGRPGGRAGVLEDYTHLADGLLALYEATFDERWFATARALMDRVLARFADPAGGFFDTADDHERLVTRPKDVQDNAVPSGNAMAARVLLRLRGVDRRGGLPRRRGAGDAHGRAVRGRYPTGFAQWLSAMDLALAPVVEVADRRRPGRPGDGRARSPRPAGYRPNQVVAVAADPAPSAVPLLHDRIAIDGRPSAYVCRGFVCRLPVTDPAALRDGARCRRSPMAEAA